MPKSYFSRTSRLFPIVLSLMAIPALPLAAGAVAVQQDPVGNRPLDPEYADQQEREQREQRRKDQEALHAANTCASGCVDHEGLQTRPIPGTTLVAVVHQAKLEDDGLTLRLRFYNDGAEPARLTIDPTTGYESFFVQVGREKLFIRKDEDGELDAKDPLALDLKPGKMESWWAKFPAPPEGTESFHLEIPPVAAFRSVPLEGR
jgi:hypothetical protein